jgi:hypothetical protein
VCARGSARNAVDDSLLADRFEASREMTVGVKSFKSFSHNLPRLHFCECLHEHFPGRHALETGHPSAADDDFDPAVVGYDARAGWRNSSESRNDTRVTLSPKRRTVGHLRHGVKHLPIHPTSPDLERLPPPWAPAQSRKPRCSRDLPCRSVEVHSDLRV